MFLPSRCLAFARSISPIPLIRAHKHTLSRSNKSRFTKAKRNTMKIAVEGCCHGQLDAIYSHIQELETRNSYKVDLLLICGDFQAIRNHADLQCMAVPDKYKELGGFYKYYTGEKKAPILTIVIGGNHEASNYMWELYHGGWLAPNIYFLGHAGCVQVNGIRIAGASGIFKPHDFHQGHHERLPYTSSSMRSIYHVREFNIRRLSLLSRPTIFLSHDWPQSIEHHGNLQALLARKSFFKSDINNGTLGSPPLMGLLRTLKPMWWFAAHLHTRYEASVTHELETSKRMSPDGLEPQKKNPDEIVIEDEQEDDSNFIKEKPEGETLSSIPAVEEQTMMRNPEEIRLEDEESTVEVPVVAQSPPHITSFLALDKCLPKRKFLEVIDIQGASTPMSTNKMGKKSRSPSPIRSERTTPVLTFDPEWLAITRAFHSWFSTTRHQPAFPDESQARALVAEARQWVIEHLQQNNSMHPLLVSDIQTFTPTAPGPDLKEYSAKGRINFNKIPQPPPYSNPQTEAFCRMMEIENKVNH